MPRWIEPLRVILEPLPHSVATMAGCALIFAALAWLAKGSRSIDDARSALGETRINLTIAAIGQLALTPLITLFIMGLIGVARAKGFSAPTDPFWTRIGEWPTLLAAVFLGDFIGYWRHRAQHLPWLWPAHAIHHSDTRMTWLTLERMHPVDQFGSALDTVILGALGFPIWALAGNVFVRHYYGYLIHADLPWTLGKANWLMNSPVMHRWHHTREGAGEDRNFATVFSIFDRAFGTYYQPGPCGAPLGVREDMGHGALGQYLHPFKAWWALIRGRPTPASPGLAAQLGADSLLGGRQDPA